MGRLFDARRSVISPQMLSAATSVHDLFGLVYEQQIRDAVSRLFPHSLHNSGLHDTLNRAANHYHAGVVCLLGDLIELDCDVTTTLAALAEYSWTGLVILDDLGDREEVRRGAPALWLKESTLYASQVALVAPMDVMRVLDLMSRKGVIQEASVWSYAATIARIARGQIMRPKLTMLSRESEFIRIMLAISSHLRWACGVVMFRRSEFSKAANRGLRYLSVAAGIKNDVEDTFPPNPRYTLGEADIANGQVTYPLYLLFQVLDEHDRAVLMHLMGGGAKGSRVVGEVQRMLSQHGECAILDRLAWFVSRAAETFGQAWTMLPLEARESAQRAYMDEWIRSYLKVNIPR